MRTLTTLGRETVRHRGNLTIDLWKPMYEVQTDDNLSKEHRKDIGEFYQIKFGDKDLATLLFSLATEPNETDFDTYDLGEVVFILHKILKDKG